MSLPNKVKVAGHTYDIEWMPDTWMDDAERHGDCTTTLLRIRILKDKRWKETLIHEIGHAIYYEYGLVHVEEEEAINSLYMSGMHQVITDNLKIAKAILEGPDEP